MTISLLSILNSIKLPELDQNTEFNYYVKSIPGFEKHYFGKIGSGEPTLLLSSKDRSVKTPVKLTELEVCFSVPCDISNKDGLHSTEIFTSISCKSKDPNLQKYYIHICETILRIIGTSPTIDQIENAVERLIHLFQKLNYPPVRSLVGLFGELFTINVAKSPELAVQAWRNKIDERFDFSIADVRLEVKTTSNRKRTHEFSLEQCHPPINTIGILVSLCVETSGGGLSIRELIERIENQIGSNPELQFKFKETLVESLGSNILSALSMRFDENIARSSLKIYEIDSIPTVCKIFPDEVSKVRFNSDLSKLLSANRIHLENKSTILDKILPVDL